jgi:hypothetical protein
MEKLISFYYEKDFFKFIPGYMRTEKCKYICVNSLKFVFFFRIEDEDQFFKDTKLCWAFFHETRLQIKEAFEVKP